MLRILQLLSIGRSVSPEVRTSIATLMHELETAAAATKSPNDDVAVALVSAILTILGLY